MTECTHSHVVHDRAVSVRQLLVTSKDDGVKAGFAPQLHEVNHVTEAQRRMTSENHTRLTELTAEVSMNTGVVLQFVGLDQLKVDKNSSTEAYIKILFYINSIINNRE